MNMVIFSYIYCGILAVLPFIVIGYKIGVYLKGRKKK